MVEEANLAYGEMMEEISKLPRTSSFKIECSIILPKMKITPYRVVEIDIEKDFAQAICDDGVITVSMSMADYHRYVIPAAEDVTLELIYYFTSETDDTVQFNVKPLIVKYRAYPRDVSNVELQSLPNMDKDQTLIEVGFDITSLVGERMRMTDVGGIYEGKCIDLLRVMFHEISRTIELPSDELSKGSVVVPPDTDTELESIIVKDGTRLIDLPQYLNKFCGGIYNFDIGCYYYKQRWYFYPTLNTNRYSDSSKTIDIYVAPPNQAPGSTRTWKRSKDKSKLSIVTTGDYKQRDVRDEQFLTKGNGVRFGKATNLFESWSKTDSNLVEVNYEDTMAEFVISNRESELQQIKSIDPTDNVAAVLTELQQRTGYYILVTWENSRPDLVIPGTPVKFYFQSEEGVKVLDGTVLRIETNYMQVNPGMGESRFISNTAMELFIADADTPII